MSDSPSLTDRLADAIEEHAQSEEAYEAFLRGNGLDREVLRRAARGELLSTRAQRAWLAGALAELERERDAQAGGPHDPPASVAAVPASALAV